MKRDERQDVHMLAIIEISADDLHKMAEIRYEKESLISRGSRLRYRTCRGEAGCM